VDDDVDEDHERRSAPASLRKGKLRAERRKRRRRRRSGWGKRSERVSRVGRGGQPESVCD